MIKKMILLLLVTTGSLYAMAGKLIVEDLKALGAEWNKRPDIDFVDDFALVCIAANIAEEQAAQKREAVQKNSAAKSSEAHAAFLQTQYNH